MKSFKNILTILVSVLAVSVSWASEDDFNTQKPPQVTDSGYRVFVAGLGYGKTHSNGERCKVHASFLTMKLRDGLSINSRCIYLPGPAPHREEWVLWGKLDISHQLIHDLEDGNVIKGKVESKVYSSCEDFDSLIGRSANQYGDGYYFSFLDFKCVNQVSEGIQLEYTLWTPFVERIIKNAVK